MKYSICILLCLVFCAGGCRKSEPLKIVCFGDSLTVCGGEGGRYSDYLQQWMPDCTVINKGKSGDTLDGGKSRFQSDVLDINPDIVVIELGANDFWHANRPPEELSADLEYLVAGCHRSGAQVVIASCFGDRRYLSQQPRTESDRLYNKYSAAIAEFETDIVRRYGCFYVPDIQADILPNGRAPYWSDDCHPNKLGNELVAKRIHGELVKAVRRVRQK